MTRLVSLATLVVLWAGLCLGPTSATAAADSSYPRTPEGVARAWLAAWARQDFATFDRFVAPSMRVGGGGAHSLTAFGYIFHRSIKAMDIDRLAPDRVWLTVTLDRHRVKTAFLELMNRTLGRIADPVLRAKAKREIDREIAKGFLDRIVNAARWLKLLMAGQGGRWKIVEVKIPDALRQIANKDPQPPRKAPAVPAATPAKRQPPPTVKASNAPATTGNQVTRAGPTRSTPAPRPVSADELARFVPDRLGQFKATRPARRKQKNSPDGPFSWVQRTYKGPGRLMAVVAISYKNSSRKDLAGLAAKGRSIKVLGYSAAAYKPMAGPMVAVSVVPADRLMVSVVVINSADHQASVDLFKCLDHRGLVRLVR
jgi:hypothetical protein